METWWPTQSGAEESVYTNENETNKQNTQKETTQQS